MNIVLLTTITECYEIRNSRFALEHRYIKSLVDETFRSLGFASTARFLGMRNHIERHGALLRRAHVSNPVGLAIAVILVILGVIFMFLSAATPGQYRKAVLDAHAGGSRLTFL